MNRLYAAAIAATMTLFFGCSRFETPKTTETYTGPLLVSDESTVAGVPQEVEYADFWIRKASDPDVVLMTPERIEEFNRTNPLRASIQFDIPSMPAESKGQAIREYLAASARYLLENPFYITGDLQLEKTERTRIAALMDTSGVPDTIVLRFGIMLERAEGKVWPTTIPLMAKPNDNEFDMGMASTVNLGDPVALLHTSKDRLWCYVQTENFTCWIPSSVVAFGKLATLRELADRSMPLVAVGDKVPVYGNPDDPAAIGYLNMGSYLPIRSIGNAFCEVLVPGRGTVGDLVVKRGYVRRGSDVSVGFLPFTIRNVYDRLFILYGSRYGWGGMYDSRDCSAYVMDVFRCFNIRLPRNSQSQGKVGTRIIPLGEMDRTARIQSLRSLPGGITLLVMPGHVMVHLGEAGGRLYAISNVWAWREGKGEGVDVAHRLARVAVTDLVLGEGSSKKAFIDRIETVVTIGR